VAYAPHVLIDVKKWDVDFTDFNIINFETERLAYETNRFMDFVSLLYRKNPYKLQPGGPGYAVYGAAGVIPYHSCRKLVSYFRCHCGSRRSRLIGYLTDQKRGVKIVGDKD